LAEDGRFATAPDRSHHRAQLRPVLQERLSTRTAAEWFDVFTEARLPCAPINDVRGGIEFAQRLGLEPIVTVGRDEGALPGIRHPITFSETPVSYDHIPPGVDADRNDILQWLDSADPRGQAPVTGPA
jgi:crotonobetainyl-CoA:carnitine CoA-transferase CaiB-like acyl-CoA transferase